MKLREYKRQLEMCVEELTIFFDEARDAMLRSIANRDYELLHDLCVVFLENKKNYSLVLEKLREIAEVEKDLKQIEG